MSNPNEKTTDMQDILDLEGKKRKWPRRLAFIFLAIVLSASGVWYFQPSPDAKASVGYRRAKAFVGDLRVIVSATGNLEPVNQVDIGTEVSGTIKTVKADYNDQVKKGQVLAMLDTTKLQSQRDAAKASLDLAKAELVSSRAAAKEAGLKLDRMKKAFKLSKGRLPSAQDIDAAQASHDKALAQVGVSKATVEKARASLAGYESDLGKAIIVAPIDGLILARKVEPGQTVAASLSAPVLFTMAENLTGMELSVLVDEADVGRVREGQKASFVVDAYPDRRFPAKITQVRFAPQTDNGVVTYECILSVDNSEHLLRPGMTATADIVTKEVNGALLVPNLALRFTPQIKTADSAVKNGQSGSFLSKLMPRPPRRQKKKRQTSPSAAQADKKARKVWILEDGRPAARVVKVGDSDGVNTQIASGDLQAGDQVLIGQEAKVK